MSALVRLARRMGWIALAIGYALAAHYTNVTAGNQTLGAALAFAPIVLASLSVAWHAAHRVAAMLLFALGIGALLLVWKTMENHFSLVYWMEHAGTELLLCFAFARTLKEGKEPLCTYFARMVHGTLTPGIARYTRQVTQAWALFFGTMALFSTLLFHFASLNAWSIFANFFTGPLIALMFVAEYLVRRWMHPDVEHESIISSVKLFWKMPARE